MTSLELLTPAGSQSPGKVLSVRERLEEHRRNPTCANCHRLFDPIGLALENFDATGAWRTLEGGTGGAPIDASGELSDGTKVDGVVSLKAARPSRTWAEVSQRAGYFDQMHLVKDFKSLTETPPSRLISQLGPTGDDYFGPRPGHAARVEPGRSDQGAAVVSASY